MQVVPRGEGLQWPPRVKRIRQVARKELSCIQLRCEAVLDVLERRTREGHMELQFRHHESNFDSLQARSPPELRVLDDATVDTRR